MRKVCLALTAAASLAAAPAFAAEPPEPPISNPSSIVDSVDADQFADLMRELGAQQVQVREAQTGQKVVTYFNGEVPYNATFSLCDIRPGKCLAVTMLVVVNLGTADTPPLESLNNLNAGLYVTAVKIDAHRFAVGRVEIVDGGVTKKNLAINAASFIVTFQAQMQALSQQVVASAQPRTANLSAPVRPRAVFATPAEIATVAKAMSANYATTLQRARR